MTVIGVLLILIAALLLLAVLVGGSGEPALLDMGLFDISTTTLGVFLIGAATAAILASGLALLRSGLPRSVRRQRELRRARGTAAEQPGNGSQESEEPATGRRGTEEPGADPPDSETRGPVT